LQVYLARLPVIAYAVVMKPRKIIATAVAEFVQAIGAPHTRGERLA
jgi:hypothetical protein